jgi:hypothetical protein
MAQTLEIPNDLVEARLRIGKFSEPCDNGLDKLTRQPRDALVLGLDAGAGLQHKAPDVDRETKGEHEGQEQIDAPAQGQSLPHRMFPVATSVPTKRHLTTANAAHGHGAHNNTDHPADEIARLSY